MFQQVVRPPSRKTTQENSSRKYRCILFYLIKMAVDIVVDFAEAVFTKIIHVFPSAVGAANQAPGKENIRDVQEGRLGRGESLLLVLQCWGSGFSVKILITPSRRKVSLPNWFFELETTKQLPLWRTVRGSMWKNAARCHCHVVFWRE